MYSTGRRIHSILLGEEYCDTVLGGVSYIPHIPLLFTTLILWVHEVLCAVSIL